MRHALTLSVAALILSASAEAQRAPRTQVYYIAADEVMWDYAPSGMDQIRGIAMDSARPSLKRPGRALGLKFKKAQYREYTDASFKALKPVPAEWEHLGLLGPVVRAEVGDTIKIVFRNNGTKPYSVHPHGVFYNKDSEGTPYRDGTSGSDKADDEVQPGATHTYVWPVPERAGPGPHDPSSIMWMYHSHVDEGVDVPTGLMGPMIVTGRGKSKPDGTPIDVDREFVVNFSVVPEGWSHYRKENVARALPWINADSMAGDDQFQNNSNFFDTMNGFVWGNMPMLTVEEGERVRWYVMASTTEFDFHTPHWHGNTVLVHGNRMDIISVEPMMMVHADMVADNPGIWFFHCHLKVHLEGGMAARYTVLPKADQVARANLTNAAKPLLAKADPFNAGTGKLPGSWKARPDRGDVRPEILRFITMDNGVHSNRAPSGVFYDPSHMGKGAYRARATFTQTTKSEHPEAYGLLLGGKDLEAANQSYLYFVIRQDGKFLVKHRAGKDTHTLVDWAIHSAVRQPDEAGKATNELAVEVEQDQVRFLVNGSEVAALPRDPQKFETDGIVGLRINHNLDLHIAGLAVEPLRSARRAMR